MGFFDNIPGMWARKSGGGRSAPTRSGSHAGGLVGDVQTSPVTSSVPTRSGSHSGGQVGGYVQQRQSAPSAAFATRHGVGGMQTWRRGDTPTPGPRGSGSGGPTVAPNYHQPWSSNTPDASSSNVNDLRSPQFSDVLDRVLSSGGQTYPGGEVFSPAPSPYDNGRFGPIPMPNQQQAGEMAWRSGYNDFINGQWALNFGMAAPIFAAYDAQEARKREMLGQLGSQYGRRRTNLNREYGFDMRDLGLNERDIGIDRGENQADRDLFNALKGTARESFDNDISQIRSKADQDRLLTDSEYIGRGAWFSPRRKTKQGWIDEGQEQAEKDRQIGFRESILNLDRKLTGTRARDAKLDIMAERVGIDRERLKERLDFGLAQLGWDQYTNTNQLLDQLDGLDAQRYDAIMQVLTSIIEASNNYTGGAVGDAITQAGG